jgi:predicted enzyme related to lactoylglutathione lyase
MTLNARYVHTNLVAEDWRGLARFYEEVFGCVRLTPEREIAEEWLSESIGLPDAALQGVHLRLPGYGEAGPTLEIFTYRQNEAAVARAPNRPGFGHIAFAVEDVEAARAAVLAAGGSEVGRIVRAQVPGAGEITLVYMADPEGNLIEIQRWAQ